MKRLCRMATILCLIILCAITAHAEELPFECHTDPALTQESMSSLIQKKIADINSEQSPWSDEISLFQIGYAKIGPPLMPSTGDVKVLVLLMEFKDEKFQTDIYSNMQNLFFSTQDITNNNLKYSDLSVCDYYKKVSFNKLRLSGTVLPIYTAQENREYYESYDDNAISLFSKEIAKALQSNKDIIGDLSKYDSNNDGYIDCLHVIYAGPSGEWASKWWGSLKNGQGQEIYDSIKVGSYPGFSEDSAGLFTAAHEMGHLLGLPDNYDTGASVQCILPSGCADLMSGGGYYVNALYRYLLDWDEPKTLPYEDMTQEIELYASDIYDSEVVNNKRTVVFVPDNSLMPFAEFYIMEYRASKIMSSFYPGIVAWHCNIEKNPLLNGFTITNNYIKPVYKSNDETEFKSEDLYRIDSDIDGEWSSGTTPSSNFYDDVYTGSYMKVLSMDDEKATIQAGFKNPDLSPAPSITISPPSKKAVKSGEKQVEFTVTYENAETIGDFGTNSYFGDYYSILNYIQFDTTGTADATRSTKIFYEGDKEVPVYVKNIQGEGTIRVTIKERSAWNVGNLGARKYAPSAISEIIYVDSTPPEITLNGDSEITLEYGEEYIEQGAAVTDNLDPDIESKLEITGVIDINKAGTYTVAYNATDHAGNIADEVVRTVTVLEPKQYIVILNTNGGTLETDLTEYIHGIGALIPTPIKTGYIFDGWYDNAEYRGPAITNITSSDTGDKIYYAKWTKCSHNQRTEITTLNPTCTTTGTKSLTCQICNATWTETIEMLPHTEVVDVAILATCETTGKTEGTHCFACGKVITAQEIVPATGHTFSESEWETDNEKHWHECSVCHKNVNETTHIKDEGTVIKQPTTEETGIREYKCTVCGFVMQVETIDKLPITHIHNFDVVKYDDKTHWHECLCGEKSNDKEIHNVISTITKEPTCTEKGVNILTCSCGYAKTEEIPIIPHTLVTDEAVMPTCETAGKTEGSHCEICNTVITTQTEIPALGHDWGKWNITKKPSIMESGEAERICLNDNTHKEMTEIPNLSNDIWKLGKRIEPTEETQGSQEYISEYGIVTLTIPVLPPSDRVQITHLSDNDILVELIFNKTEPPKDNNMQLFVTFRRNGVLQSVQMPQLTNLSASFNIPDKYKDCEIIIYVWDKNMKPLMDTQKIQ